ncbi:DUF4392 domain-containing protein [Wukongibacter baidiensis]|uniref:DUF4392 domain-containing protein n=1 Tax=Wukongibacter baidiensis TaxID=1723361 RepID=UPI003D7F6873
MKIKYIREIENIIRKNLDQRGLDRARLVNELEKAAIDLLKGTTVFIVTGFVVKDSLTGETDGPIGAISLAGALEILGKKVVLITDRYTEGILYSCCSVKGVKAPIEVVSIENTEESCYELLEKYKPSHVVAVERPGRSKDGHCYSMRGEDLSDLVPNTDLLFERAKELGMTTLAVGDGGNEVGMGKVASFVVNFVNNGEKICADISTDYLILAGVSNWGGHALSAALSIFTNTMLLHDNKTETLLLKSMIDAGSVDGCTKKTTLTVDGLSLEDNLYILERIRNTVEAAIGIESKNIIA